MKQNVEYLGKYIKRPPIGETRIKKYDGKFVTYQFLDHYTNTTQHLTLPVMDFIARLIAHVPDKHFRNIRYYGFLSNRTSSKLLPIVYKLLNMARGILSKTTILWKDMIRNTFSFDPTSCPCCKTQMQFSLCIFTKHNILSKHKEIAHVVPEADSPQAKIFPAALRENVIFADVLIVLMNILFHEKRLLRQKRSNLFTFTMKISHLSRKYA
jgi:hypothetical protein